MLCTQLDSHMKDLCHVQLMISWQITLTDGTSVYGDYERPNTKNPWIRLAEHCKQNDVLPAKVQLYMFGADQKVFFENPNGLDGISVVRGVAQDQSMDGSYCQSYQTLTVCLLRDDCSKIDVSKYVWPFNNLEKLSGTRELTQDNLKLMIFKNDSEKRTHPDVQKHLNGAGL
jgi:hypothetical protein